MTSKSSEKSINSVNTLRTSKSIESNASICSEKLGFDDVIVKYLGQFGRYQKLTFFLVCLPTIITSMDSLSWTFSGAKTTHRCKGITETAKTDYWSPPSESFIFDRQNCSLLDHPNLKECPFVTCAVGNSRCPNGYVYDNSSGAYTAIERWDIVCDKSILRAFIQSMYYMGQMLGSLIFGFLGDRIGRKKVFFVALVIQFISGFGMALSPHWSLYALFRMGVGFAHPGIFVIAVVIGVELIGPKYRQLSSVLASVFWSTGQVILGILAYNVRDYRYLHASIAFPSLLFVSYWWIIPESARWLVAHKQFKKADKVLQRAAKINRTYLPQNWYEHCASVEDLSKHAKTEHHSFKDLIKTPTIRKRALASFFCWPVCSMLYYGVSMNTNFLGGDFYLTFIFGGLSEYPAIILTGFLVDKIGRKPMLVGAFITAAVAMLSSTILDGEIYPAIGITQFLLSKSALASAYTSLYIFTPELFPTVIRNSAMGACSTIARIGAITASYVSMWLIDSIGKMIMVIPFAFLAIVAAAIIVFCLPETTGKQLHDSIEDVEKKE